MENLKPLPHHNWRNEGPGFCQVRPIQIDWSMQTVTLGCLAPPKGRLVTLAPVAWHRGDCPLRFLNTPSPQPATQ